MKKSTAADFKTTKNISKRKQARNVKSRITSKKANRFKFNTRDPFWIITLFTELKISQIWELEASEMLFTAYPLRLQHFYNLGVDEILPM